MQKMSDKLDFTLNSNDKTGCENMTIKEEVAVMNMTLQERREICFAFQSGSVGQGLGLPGEY